MRNVHQVELPEELDRFVRREVAAGRFPDANAALAAGIERLREEAVDRARFRDALEEGWRQAEAGRVAEGDAAFRNIRDRLRAKHGDVL